MTNTPLVSVIVPCYNYGRFIPETLRSLQAQNFQDWECIVVDDGSKDDTAEVVRPFMEQDPRIRYVYQENKGLPTARNTGINNSIGKYIQFLDSDDLLEVDKLKLQAEYLEQHPTVDLVYSGLRYFYDGTTELICSPEYHNTPWTLDKSGNGRSLLPYLVISCVIMPPMPMLRRTTLLNVIGLFVHDLRSCEDWEFWQRCCYTDINFAYLDAPKTWSLMRLHPNSMTRNRTVMMDSFIEVRQRLCQHLQHDPALLALNNALMNNAYIERAIITQQLEGHLKGVRQAYGFAKNRGSLIFFCWLLILLITPPILSLKLLSFQRTIYKRWNYRKLSKKTHSLGMKI